MRVEGVRIRNFRCFKELDLSISKTHSLIGENGSGKTALLEAINLATSQGQPRFEEQDFNNGDDRDIEIEVTFDDYFLIRIPDGYASQDILCNKVKVTAHRREKAAPGKALSDPFVVDRYVVPVEYASGRQPALNLPKETPKLNIPIAVKRTVSGYESPRKSSDKLFQFTTNRLGLQYDLINYPSVFYFGRDREDQAKIGFNSILQRVAKDLNWRFRREWDHAAVAKKWDEFNSLVVDAVDNPKNGRIMKPIRTRLKKIAGIDFSDLELGLLDIEQPFLRSFFALREGTNQIELKRCGSGVSVLVAYILLETISSLAKGHIIFLIDEPELHLHPQLQHSLFAEFQGSTNQTIYTTQSDCFVDIAEWQSISRFQRGAKVTPDCERLKTTLEDKSLSVHLDQIGQFHQQKTIFFREDNQLFFARKCLLVEGPAEKYGIPVLAQRLKKSFSEITIVSCNGKQKIPYYQLLCKCFEIPFFTLFDLDKKPLSDKENLRPASWANDDARFTFSSSFEELCGINKNVEHKASMTLIKIDEIESKDINTEIEEAIKSIGYWSDNCLTKQ